MTTPVVGFSVIREALEPATASNAKMSVIGLIGPVVKAASADQAAFDAAFVVNTPILFNSTDAVARMIEPDSEIGRALSLINAQTALYQQAAQIILVPVTAGASASATIANIIGNAASGTGLYAFKKCGALLGVYPRLIAAPGFTSQPNAGVSKTVTVSNGGSGYTSAPTVAFSGGGSESNKVLPTGHAVISGGAVTGVVIDTIGANMTTAPTIAFSGGGGSGAAATATLDSVTNAVCAALPGVLNSILAIAVVSAPGSSRTGDVTFRSTIASERIMVVTPTAKMLDSDGDTVVTDLAPAVLGLFVRRDSQYDGRPFRSPLNQPVYGIIGAGRDIDFNLLDGASEGQDLLSNQIGPLVRGQSGNDFAISDGGYVFMGFENVADELTWRQIHKVRGRDFIELTAIRTLRQYLGKYNLTTQTVKTIVDVVDDILAIAQGNGEILGRTVKFDKDANNETDFRSGHIYVDARFEEAPVFRKMTLKSRPYSQAITLTIESLLASQGIF